MYAAAHDAFGTLLFYLHEREHPRPKPSITRELTIISLFSADGITKLEKCANALGQSQC